MTFLMIFPCDMLHYITFITCVFVLPDNISTRTFFYENFNQNYLKWLMMLENELNSHHRKRWQAFSTLRPRKKQPPFCEIRATSHYLNKWWLVYWRIYALLGLSELIIHALLPNKLRLYSWISLDIASVFFIAQPPSEVLHNFCVSHEI